MPLVPALRLIARAKAKQYAVGYFESWSLDSLQGVIDAAEETRSPVLIGVNGAFLSRPGRLAEERLAWHAALGRAAAQSSRTACGLVFNECGDDAWIRQAVGLGFSLVMPDDPEAPPAAFARRVRALARDAHRRGAAIEVEVGHLPCGAPGTLGEGVEGLTDPQRRRASSRPRALTFWPSAWATCTSSWRARRRWTWSAWRPCAALGASAVRAVGTTRGVFTAGEAEAFLATHALSVQEVAGAACARAKPRGSERADAGKAGGVTC